MLWLTTCSAVIHMSMCHSLESNFQGDHIDSSYLPIPDFGDCICDCALFRRTISTLFHWVVFHLYLLPQAKVMELMHKRCRLPMAASMSLAAVDMLDAGCLFGLGAHLLHCCSKIFYTAISNAAITIFNINIPYSFLNLFFLIITSSLDLS